MIIVSTLLRIIDPALYCTLVSMYVVSVIVFGICFAIQHIVGGICEVVEATIGWAVHNRKLEALANLNNGVCDDYKDIWVVIDYMFEKIVGFPSCREIYFYESITLTRIFVADPLNAIGTCVSYQHDICAGIVGGQTVAKFVFLHGVYLYYVCYVLSPTVLPILRWTLKRIWKAYRMLSKAIHKLLNKNKK